ncbi:ankyrin repeat domain-containing protein [Rickettsia endosymbiont of Ixodes scapularis]|uniref:ankyrin repeat domain-containing protein n=1 Tax=Rickettsia endosymbiont of Ixodes scapularis TaxID=444612 RepID=UPI003527384D
MLETARDGLEKVCELLINRMSITAINHVNNNGYTALTWAVANGYERVCELLIPKILMRLLIRLLIMVKQL